MIIIKPVNYSAQCTCCLAANFPTGGDHKEVDKLTEVNIGYNNQLTTFRMCSECLRELEFCLKEILPTTNIKINL